MNRRHSLLLAGIVVVAILLAFLLPRSTISPPIDGNAAVAVPIERIDQANEGRLISVLGELKASSPARDDELGMSAADALVLVRHVEMYQWRERCIAEACSQEMAWSETLINSANFREPAGHTNPASMPFESKRFSAKAISVGVFSVDSQLLESRLEMRQLPIRLSDLSPNLAASFVEFEGGVFSGQNPLAPEVGDLRVSYFVIPTQIATVTGVQRGSQLVVAGDVSN